MDLRTKVLHSPQEISFRAFADTKTSGNWFKAFTATYLITTKSRFRRIPTYAPCPASNISKLHTYMATTTIISEYHLLSTTPYCTASNDNTVALKIAHLPKMQTRSKYSTGAPHHFREFVCDRFIGICPVSTDNLLADLFYKPMNQINVVRQHL